MRYLKEYRLFEGLSQDFKDYYDSKLVEYRQDIIDKFKEYKDLVESHLYDILDYNLKADQSLNKIKTDNNYIPHLMILSYELEVNKDIDIFLNDLVSANNRLNEELGLSISSVGSIDFIEERDNKLTKRSFPFKHIDRECDWLKERMDNVLEELSKDSKIIKLSLTIVIK